VAIVVAMIAVGKRIPTRGALDLGKMPTVFSGNVEPKSAILGLMFVSALFIVLPDGWGLALLTSVIFSNLARANGNRWRRWLHTFTDHRT
jgi:hypothetical protein